MEISALHFLTKWGIGRSISRGVSRYYRNESEGQSISSVLISADWETFFIYLFCSLVLLFISAYLAQIELYKIPKNPLRWHLFVMEEVVNPSNKYEKNWTNVWWIHMLFWWLSAAALVLAIITLFAIFSHTQDNNSTGW
jgi:hypothetical protein